MRILVACVPAAGHFDPLTPPVEALIRQGDEVVGATAEDPGGAVARLSAVHWPGYRGRAMDQNTLQRIDTSDMLFPHNAFRAAFADAQRAVGSVRQGDTSRAAVIGSFYDNMLRFLEAHHGSEDELVWPRLRVRAPEQSALLDRMEGQHTAIAELDGAAKRALGSWKADPTVDNARSLTEALRSLGTELQSHFLEEEGELLPLAAATMSEEEWGELPGHAMRTFTGDKLWLILGLVFEQMTEEQRSLVLAHLPPPVREMWFSSGEAAFAAFIRDLRSTG